jgi:hypothetical protein
MAMGLRAVAVGAALVALACTGCSSSSPSTATGTTTAPTVSASTAAPAPPVPPQYQGLVATLQGQLSSFATQVGSSPSGGHTVMAANLIAADGNIGLGLLTPNALTTASTMLQRFKQMGLRGIMLEVGFPLLLPSFPNSAGYTSFYQRVARMIHADNMTLSVEVNPVFTSPQISSLHPDYRGLTVDSYAAEQRQEAQAIIDTMHPDYLTILDEPDTFGSNLALPLNNPATVVQLVNLELTGLTRGSTRVGAGTGTWSPPAYDQALLAQTAINYLSVHVYPLAQLDVQNLNTDLAAANQAHRPAVMDEVGFYKNLISGNFDATGTIHANATGAANEQKLLAFSFFEPLDRQVLTLITRYARNHSVALVAPFDTPTFFAYVDWTPTLDATPNVQFRSVQTQALRAAMAAGTLSSVGRTYSHLATSK